jgi:hypothetical protein
MPGKPESFAGHFILSCLDGYNRLTPKNRLTA